MTVTAATTAWETGRLDARLGPGKLLFGCMHEDAEIERRWFPANGRVFCIASAGCTAMALSAGHEVVAVDINPVQIAYVRRRLASGSLEMGSAERLLALARRFAALAGWTRNRLSEFLSLAEPNEQLAHWQRHLDTRRFRAALDLVFGRNVLRMFYAAELFTVLPADFPAVLRRRLERGFARHPNLNNPYARMLLLGERMPAPPQSSAERIQLFAADAATFLESQPAGSFTAFSLSNILDGANATYAARLAEAVQHAAAPQAMVILRSFREPIRDLPDNCAADDRSMLWGVVGVWTIAEFSRFSISSFGLR